ncbi:MAG: hypothetical protein GF329_05240 [Candidatus Lokiarchaeota archaeon]|nr:hypothetical protein [Candidatus Lokiarchaeota archaeon]
MKQFYKIIITIIIFIISSVIPFYYVTYYSATNIFTSIYIFSVWVAFTSLLLSYIIEDNRKLIFVIFFWAMFFLFSFGTDTFGVGAIDPLLYGMVYSSFFIMCGSILYKWKIELHDRLMLVTFGYLFQGVYDWFWWLIQYLDPGNAPFGNWNSRFYVDLIVLNSTLGSVFVVELINLALAIGLLFLYPRKNWDYIIGCVHWLGLQLCTLALSDYNINFPYVVLYILFAISFTFYLLMKYKQEEVFSAVKKFINKVKELFRKLINKIRSNK